MTDIHPVAAKLLQELGRTLVSGIAGEPNRALVEAWAQPGGPSPSMEQAERLQVALEVWNTVAVQEGSDVTRMWFIGDNPFLNDMVVNALREDRLEAVRTAAAQMASPEQMGL